jgi:uncharacterized protein
MTQVPYQQVADFLRQRRLAILGLSRDGRSYSRGLYKELVQRGYDIVPVNPHMQELDGRICYAKLEDVRPAPAAVMMVLPREAYSEALRDCARAGVTRVWIPLGKGPLTHEDRQIVEQAGITLILGLCPHMFLDHTQFIHRLHGFAARLGGQVQRPPRGAPPIQPQDL